MIESLLILCVGGVQAYMMKRIDKLEESLGEQKELLISMRLLMPKRKSDQVD